MTTANASLHAVDIRRRSYSMAVLGQRVDGGQDVVTHSVSMTAVLPGKLAQTAEMYGWNGWRKDVYTGE